MSENLVSLQGLNLDQHLNTKLFLKGYRPPPYRESGIWTAAFASNERTTEGFYRAIKKRCPDGYIVGVGGGMTLSLPLVFNHDTSPKGIVLVDIDKRVVALTKAFVKALKVSKSSAEFYNKFYLNPFELAKNFLSDEPDLIKVLEETPQSQRSDMEDHIKQNKQDFNHRFDRMGHVNLDNALAASFNVWKELAVNNKIAVIQGSLTDVNVIDVITSLPEYQTSTNLVYLSNIADHIPKPPGGFTMEQYSQVLKSFNEVIAKYNPSDKPAIFIDTLRTMAYWLRTTKGAPHFCIADLHGLPTLSTPDEVRTPNLIFHKSALKYTPLNLSNLDFAALKNMQQEAKNSLFNKFKGVDQKRIYNMTQELTDYLWYRGKENPEVFGELEPLEWVRIRYGETIYTVVSIDLELYRRKSE